MNASKHISLTLALSAISTTAVAEVYLTPWVGYTAGGSVENQNQQELDLKGSESFALSVETDFDTGRLGLFYSTQSTDVESTNANSTIHYLHFQSSVYYPIEDKFSSYLGIGLGGSYIDADWVNKELGFSASIFGGFEYKFSDTVALNTQLRWLGTVVDNDTSGVCNLPTTGEGSCVIKFKTDWMNQFSANLGLTVRF
ncbi:porin family protein [Vibrio europaeus]|uniref:Outer membrane beta-barrel protein n=1 Tax=Vibrio europaeus TaxID=300876 RepID=A0AAE7AUA7_9VIBR|nr:outer membrane beta-barrel protein [Vibrio europaeus]MDC5807234.1 porin family protein [Vibrio europaeus]MDC5809829.1 porin family protein [Vibrio europaeus]MDC5827759.1 porin family protein [Vibrio europaeus]MDC5830603.1 porin family protein [Vibrio europaeus]MDC5837459.1 porin family protein [Vibrio europaeus]